MKFAAALVLLSCSAFAQQVEIVLATYGSTQLHDVTTAVRSAIARGRRDLPVTLDALGVSDPAPGRVKTLRIVYRTDGALLETMANDFETISLPAGTLVTPAAAATPSAGGPPTASQPTTVQSTTGGFFDTPGAPASSAAPGAAAAGAAGAASGSTAGAASTPASAPVTISPVSSVPNGACFYTQANYAGTPYCYAAGSATATLGDQRRRFRSVRLVGSAKAVWLFDADNFTGASVRLTQAQADLRAAQGGYYSTDFEDRAASLKVE